MEQIAIGNIKVDVVLKNIKNIHLSVYPPSGRVHISAPLRMNLDTIRIYAISKLSWIKSQQNKFRAQVRETQRQYLNKESHYYLGKRYMLTVLEVDTTPLVVVKHKTIELYVKPRTSFEKKQKIIDDWYRNQLKELTIPIVEKWESVMGVSVNEIGVRKMKTKWGTCNNETKRIWLNLELAKKPFHCIEYIIVHELVHLLERNHNERFLVYMDKFLPEWRILRQELNSLPVSHVEWKY